MIVVSGSGLRGHGFDPSLANEQDVGLTTAINQWPSAPLRLGCTLQLPSGRCLRLEAALWLAP